MNYYNCLFWGLIFFCGGMQGIAQQDSCNCFEALEFFAMEVKQAKSYKMLIKGQEKKDLDAWKAELVQEMLLDKELDFYCVAYLQKYISFIRDQHNQIYIAADKLEQYKRPIYKGDLERLEKRLEGLSLDSLEGIYFVGKEKVGLLRVDTNTWNAVVLASALDSWEKGEIHFKIKKKKTGGLECLEYYNNGQLTYRKNIMLKDGRLYPSFWSKKKEYYWYNNTKPKFRFSTLNDSTGYIAIKTFGRTTALMQEAKNFYDTALTQIVQPYLIIDLRNNGGGSILQGKPLLKLLSSQKQLKKVYVLINGLTASAAELITLNLKKDARVVVCGEPSRGVLAFSYGNEAMVTTLDCLGLKGIWTVERSKITKHSRLLELESMGIKPEWELKNNQSWIEQVQKIIGKQ